MYYIPATKSDVGKILLRIIILIIISVPVIFDFLIITYIIQHLIYDIPWPGISINQIPVVVQLFWDLSTPIFFSEFAVVIIPAVVINSTKLRANFKTKIIQCLLCTLMYFIMPSFYVVKSYPLFIIPIFLWLMFCFLFVGRIRYLNIQVKSWKVPGQIEADPPLSIGSLMLSSISFSLLTVPLYFLFLRPHWIPWPYQTNLVPLLLLSALMIMLIQILGSTLRSMNIDEQKRRLFESLCLSLSFILSLYIFDADDFAHYANDYDWMLFGLSIWMLYLITKPLYFTHFANKLIEEGKLLSETKYLRIIPWILASVAISLLGASCINLIRVLLRETRIDTAPIIIVLSVVTIIINGLIVARKDITIDEPLQDIQLHLRICSFLERDSEFAINALRKGLPTELYYTRKNTMNTIERLFPITITVVGVSLGFGIFFLTPLIASFSNVYVPLESKIVLLGLVIVALYFGWEFLKEGMFRQWVFHAAWNDFWISYWTFVRNRFQTEREFDGFTEFSWESVVDPLHWDEEYGWERNEYGITLHKNVQFLAQSLGFDDTIPSDIILLSEYVDKIILFKQIRDEVRSYSDIFSNLGTSVSFLSKSLEEFNCIKSLHDVSIEELQHLFKDMKALSVAIISPQIINDLRGLETLSSRKRNAVIQFADRRIHEISSETGSLIPDFLKWSALTYSLAIGFTNWILG